MKDNIAILNDESYQEYIQEKSNSSLSFQEYVDNFLIELLDKKCIIKSAQSININNVVIIYEEII